MPSGRPRSSRSRLALRIAAAGREPVAVKLAELAAERAKLTQMQADYARKTLTLLPNLPPDDKQLSDACFRT